MSAVKNSISTKAQLPVQSILKANEKQYHYVDSFQGDFTDKNGTVTAMEIGRFFFMSGPKWVDKLLAIRNKLVRLFGLKTSDKIGDRQKVLDNFTFEKGAQHGLFKVVERTTDEIVLGENDRHLDFRVSLLIDHQTGDITNKKLIISTTVQFHNWFGRLYFLPVKPFHKLIVPVMLKGIIKNIEL